MSAIAASTDELGHYLQARDALARLQKQVDQPGLWADVLEPAELGAERLDHVVATLCHQARAAQQLASAAEALCAVLVGENHYRPC